MDKHIYNVSAYGNDYFELQKNQNFADAESAIHKWFKLEEKYPTCAMITGFDAQPLRDWALKNVEKMREWATTYHCPYKIEYLLNECREKAIPVKREYPDQLHPFDLG